MLTTMLWVWKEKGEVGLSYNVKKKKVICAVELTDEGKVKRMYSMKINNYSSKELEKIFEKHISEKATIVTDKWKGYRPLMKQYNITQVESDHGLNFKALHTMIHQVKSWIRTTYSWVSEFNIDRYLNESCFRINRSLMKENVFNNLIRRMVSAEKIYQEKLILSLIHISEPTRLLSISYAVFCLKKKRISLLALFSG